MKKLKELAFNGLLLLAFAAVGALSIIGLALSIVYFPTAVMVTFAVLLLLGTFWDLYDPVDPTDFSHE